MPARDDARPGPRTSSAPHAGATVYRPRLTTTGVASGIAVGAGLGLALGAVLGGGPPLSAWVIIGIGAGVAVSAARDERARPLPEGPWVARPA